MLYDAKLSRISNVLAHKETFWFIPSNFNLNNSKKPCIGVHLSTIREIYTNTRLFRVNEFCGEKMRLNLLMVSNGDFSLSNFLGENGHSS